jgi:hypothetical protein
MSALILLELYVLHETKVKIRNWDIMPSGVADGYLKIKLAGASRILVPIYQMTWHHIPEDHYLNPLTATTCHKPTINAKAAWG